MGESHASGDVEAALEALDLARRRFVNVVGHELRTPVTTLRGLCEELEHASVDEIRELAPAVLRNARRIEALVEQLLLANDITTALPVGPMERVDLVATARATWDSLGSADELAISGAPMAVVTMRSGAADTMLNQILDNALRYGRAPFALAASVEHGRVRLTVSSEGSDLRADDVHLAFDLFYRGEDAVTTAPGFGLGLPVARALVRQQDGDLSLEARRGGGLDVTIDLPATG